MLSACTKKLQTGVFLDRLTLQEINSNLTPLSNNLTNLTNIKGAPSASWNSILDLASKLYKYIFLLPPTPLGYETSSEFTASEFNTLINEAKASGDRAITGLSEVKKLVSTAAENYVSQDFHDAASKEEKSYKRLRLSALILLVIAIAATLSLLYLAFLIPQPKTTGTEITVDILIRLGIVGFIYTLVIYLINSANSHRKEFFRNREISTKLNVLEPFIKDIDDKNSRDEIRKIAAQELFKTPI